MCHVPLIIKGIRLQAPLNKNPLLLTIGFWFSFLLRMGLDCVILPVSDFLLPQSPRCWDDRCMPPHLAPYWF